MDEGVLGVVDVSRGPHLGRRSGLSHAHTRTMSVVHLPATRRFHANTAAGPAEHTHITPSVSLVPHLSSLSRAPEDKKTHAHTHTYIYLNVPGSSTWSMSSSAWLSLISSCLLSLVTFCRSSTTALRLSSPRELLPNVDMSFLKARSSHLRDRHTWGGGQGSRLRTEYCVPSWTKVNGQIW